MSHTQPTLKKRAFRFQFSLRAFLILMVVIGIGLGWLGMTAGESERQKKVVAELEKLQAKIKFNDDNRSSWIPDIFNTGYLDCIYFIESQSTQMSDVSALGGLKNLESLTLSKTQVSDVSALGELKNLLYLDLTYTEVSDEDAAKLKALLTKCKIIHAKKAKSQP